MERERETEKERIAFERDAKVSDHFCININTEPRAIHFVFVFFFLILRLHVVLQSQPV